MAARGCWGAQGGGIGGGQGLRWGPVVLYRSAARAAPPHGATRIGRFEEIRAAAMVPPRPPALASICRKASERQHCECDGVAICARLRCAWYGARLGAVPDIHTYDTPAEWVLRALGGNMLFCARHHPRELACLSLRMRFGGCETQRRQEGALVMRRAKMKCTGDGAWNMTFSAERRKLAPGLRLMVQEDTSEHVLRAS